MRRLTGDGRPRSELLAWSLVALFFIVPLGAITVGAVRLAADETRATPIPEAVFVHVARDEFVDEQKVTLTLSWSDGIALKAPAWGGLVTETAVKPGDVVRAGTRLLRLDGVWRVAAPTPHPFYAPVDSASPPAEVKALNALLRDMGFDAPGDSWSWSTTTAVREFASSLGVPEAHAAWAMDPAWIVWMPSPEFAVASVPLVVGAAAPAQGEDVLIGPARLTSVSVAAEEGAGLPDVGEDDRWVLRVGDASIPYLSPEMTDALAGSPVEVALAKTRPAEADGLVQRDEAVDGWQVPVSAVHTDAGGTYCVFRRDDSDAGYAPVRVDVQRGAIGTARVEGPLEPEDDVLVNPSTVAGDAECS